MTGLNWDDGVFVAALLVREVVVPPDLVVASRAVVGARLLAAVAVLAVSGLPDAPGGRCVFGADVIPCARAGC